MSMTIVQSTLDDAILTHRLLDDWAPIKLPVLWTLDNRGLLLSASCCCSVSQKSKSLMLQAKDGSAITERWKIRIVDEQEAGNFSQFEFALTTKDYI